MIKIQYNLDEHLPKLQHCLNNNSFMFSAIKWFYVQNVLIELTEYGYAYEIIGTYESHFCFLNYDAKKWILWQLNFCPSTFNLHKIDTPFIQYTKIEERYWENFYSSHYAMLEKTIGSNRQWYSYSLASTIQKIEVYGMRGIFTRPIGKIPTEVEIAVDSLLLVYLESGLLIEITTLSNQFGHSLKVIKSSHQTAHLAQLSQQKNSFGDALFTLQKTITIQSNPQAKS